MPRSAPRQRGRAVLQYENQFAYWKHDRLVLLRPGLAPEQFRVRTGRPGRDAFEMAPIELEPSLVREALAHTTLPTWLYRERRYTWPDQSADTARAEVRP